MLWGAKKSNVQEITLHIVNDCIIHESLKMYI